MNQGSVRLVFSIKFPSNRVCVKESYYFRRHISNWKIKDSKLMMGKGKGRALRGKVGIGLSSRPDSSHGFQHSHPSPLVKGRFL